MRISDWSSDVCSSDLAEAAGRDAPDLRIEIGAAEAQLEIFEWQNDRFELRTVDLCIARVDEIVDRDAIDDLRQGRLEAVETIGEGGKVRAQMAIEEIRFQAELEFIDDFRIRSEEHTSELQSLMRISYD